MKKVGIVGAGFTGLACAYYLTRKGYKVVLLESRSLSGGLASGIKKRNWKWSLERHYHHLFVSDKAIRKLASEVGHKIQYLRPITSVYIGGEKCEIDSARSLLQFPGMSLISKIRTGVVIVLLKSFRHWRKLEGISTERFIRKSMGDESWDVLWGPLLKKKFGRHSAKIPASWFWARIKVRSSSLGYPVKGFQVLTETILKKIRRFGGNIICNFKVTAIIKNGDKIEVTNGKRTMSFDAVVCTLPGNIFNFIARDLSKEYRKKLKKISGIGASNLVLVLREPFLEKEYWLNINEKRFPFLCVVEHTNFIDSKRYGGENILYIGSYGDKNQGVSAKETLALYIPYLQKINPRFKKAWIKRMWKFDEAMAQPIVTRHYSKIVPGHTTGVEGLYLANMQQVYPWDRGTNYAVDMGYKLSNMVDKYLHGRNN